MSQQGPRVGRPRSTLSRRTLLGRSGHSTDVRRLAFGCSEGLGTTALLAGTNLTRGGIQQPHSEYADDSASSATDGCSPTRVLCSHTVVGESQGEKHVPHE